MADNDPTTTQPDFAKVVAELMTRYDEYRTKWVTQFGNADGFDEWFSSQVFSCPSSAELTFPR